MADVDADACARSAAITAAMAIDEALVRDLLASQLPAAAALSITALAGGWDNRSFRLGDRLVARLPSADRYVASAEKEACVLPLLAGRLPLPIPRLVAHLAPSARFPRRWSVVEWIEGDTALAVSGTAQVALAGGLARFLHALASVTAGWRR